jgi:hypothetical protein
MTRLEVQDRQPKSKNEMDRKPEFLKSIGNENKRKETK